MDEIPPQQVVGEVPQENNVDMMSQPLDGEENQNKFDTNFDPGVEADEETDPKKFIQQLAGKLSQSLRKYNDENGQPDVDLDKYVAGMIVSQSIKGLSKNDIDEILDKLKDNDDFSEYANDENEQPQQNGMGNQPQDLGNQMMRQPNESVGRDGDDLEEIVNGVLQGIDKGKHPYQKATDAKGFRKKPFTSPNFKKIK